jgi:hypothetical protein
VGSGRGDHGQALLRSPRAASFFSHFTVVHREGNPTAQPRAWRGEVLYRLFDFNFATFVPCFSLKHNRVVSSSFCCCSNVFIYTIESGGKATTMVTAALAGHLEMWDEAV